MSFQSVTYGENINSSQQESLNYDLPRIFYKFYRKQQRAENNNSQRKIHLLHPTGQSLALYYQSKTKLIHNIKKSTAT
jgi:hypothetical protein